MSLHLRSVSGDDAEFVWVVVVVVDNCRTVVDRVEHQPTTRDDFESSSIGDEQKKSYHDVCYLRYCVSGED